MRWSDLYDRRTRLVVELDRAGTTPRFLVLDMQDATRDNPALREEFRRCKSDDDRLRLALEWFGDLGNPQPTNRTTDWPKGPVVIAGDGPRRPLPTFRTPDWHDGRLLPLADDEHQKPKAKVAPRAAVKKGTNSFTQATIQSAVSRFDRLESQNDVAAAMKAAVHDARRVRLMYEGKLLGLNEHGKLWVDERVCRSGKRIVLRYWSNDGQPLDPIEHHP